MGIEQDIEQRLEGFDLETGEEIKKEVTPPAVETPKAETPAPPATPEDPEFDLGEGKKAKLSQIKEWEKGTMLQSDYTKKTTELAEQRKEVQDLMNLAEYLKSNPAKLKKVIAILEDKAEEVKEKVQELEGLDPNDPYAKGFSKLLSEIGSLHKRLDTYEQREKQGAEESKVAEAHQVLTKTMDETIKELKFDDFDNDEEVKSFWRNAVLSYLKDHPKNYADANDFVTTIKEIGKKYFDGIIKIGEVKLKKYLSSKNVPPPAITPTVTGEPAKKEVKPDMDNLQDVLQSEFDKVEKETQT